jgi:Xaa-Pro aminopeptidase
MLAKDFYVRTRKRLAEQMEDNTFYFVHSGNEVESTNDECYLFEPYRNFLYLVGIEVTGATLLITKFNGKVSEILFMHVPTARETMYTGSVLNEDYIKEVTGIETIMDEHAWNDRISRIMFGNDVQVAYMDMARWRMNYPHNEQQRIAAELKDAYPYLRIRNMYPTVCAFRTVKEPEEIEAHRKSAAITNEAVRCMLRNMKPGMKEYEIEAYYDFVLKSNGVKVPAFTTIAASGPNNNTLHYSDNDRTTEDGDLILFDLGAQYDRYCTDCSRTYPVNGKYTERQKQLYNAVLAGLKAAEDLSKPGQKKNELQKISKQVMAEELIKIGKISKPEEVDQYYFHGSGHFIGLNTHDVGDTEDMVLQKDMMFTLEPGLYFRDEGMGFRIEDTILITEDGCDVLTDVIPKEIDEIEAYMAQYRKEN